MLWHLQNQWPTECISPIKYMHVNNNWHDIANSKLVFLEKMQAEYQSVALIFVVGYSAELPVYTGKRHNDSSDYS